MEECVARRGLFRTIDIQEKKESAIFEGGTGF
jgi:hypothetical protein